MKKKLSIFGASRHFCSSSLESGATQVQSAAPLEVSKLDKMSKAKLKKMGIKETTTRINSKVTKGYKGIKVVATVKLFDI